MMRGVRAQIGDLAEAAAEARVARCCLGAINSHALRLYGYLSVCTSFGQRRRFHRFGPTAH
eukprot:11218385-Lingulodinium_polyedra.AAC.1